MVLQDALLAGHAALILLLKLERILACVVIGLLVVSNEGAQLLQRHAEDFLFRHFKLESINLIYKSH